MKHVFYSVENARATLILLHGTGGDEESLVSIARTLSTHMNYLGIRGNIDENGSNRFFKRLSEGVFDMKDLKFRTNELAEFIEKASKTYGFSLDNSYLVGYSNGANIAANLLLQKPNIANGAILFHAMVPSRDKTNISLEGKSVFLSAGTNDPLVANSEVEELQDLLTTKQALITLHWESNGHSISSTEIAAAKRWLSMELQ